MWNFILLKVNTFCIVLYLHFYFICPGKSTDWLMRKNSKKSWFYFKSGREYNKPFLPLFILAIKRCCYENWQTISTRVCHIYDILNVTFIRLLVCLSHYNKDGVSLKGSNSQWHSILYIHKILFEIESSTSALNHKSKLWFWGLLCDLVGHFKPAIITIWYNSTYKYIPSQIPYLWYLCMISNN